ncbi:hypothetical protein SDRG_03200 [Saprolegnia diclina VS20]|uniref:ABC transmembrane type-1 domain-containing protein n=1 Tax=Saprolegnia diclina (strain VS20) TaxID=1156394 RepID=T0QNS6_SAPDV|nr:hypothetical protein SDRG_03200 [Saprolegnia diclina VS20]EQC39774.1 hypothetical protein SDRG_03200 [Saprolegnia diclina VS20]|eukprot:XP_008607046.1 hypothetical protein SDRG_03200 [Saprolegnia diclina VS20]
MAPPDKGTKDDYVVVQTPRGPVTEDASTPPAKFSFLSLYRYATPSDWALMGVGLVMSIVSGGALPFMAILFGDALNNFTPFNQSAINETCLNYLILAIVLLVAGYGSFTCFAISAERQMRSLRREVLKHIVFQEIGWYDQRDASELASRISGDTVKIKEGMGEKLGEALRAVFQFIVGYAIGFYKGWNISLAMCAVMPMMAISLTVDDPESAGLCRRRCRRRGDHWVHAHGRVAQRRAAGQDALR